MQMLHLLLLTVAVACLNANAVPEDAARAQAIARNTAACEKWYKAEPHPLPFLEQTRNCPCRISTSFPKEFSDGGAVWKTDAGCGASSQPNTCNYHKGAWGCYRHAYKSKGPGAQCCYDRSGNWMSDPHAGAGTLDRERAPDNILNLIQWNAHNKHDVIPWDNCCKDPSMPRDVCQWYYDKRPPGQCTSYNL
ncbi:unnamed protein product [Adineta steineri]|uniref:AMOP domain-containing protein n=1 Tax=Adineta steineri TaxID=433720 RepID=A0A815J827_9BILA|nr:unnamed protein product [Adineta steineri]CAF3746339.1 unnamed protein product [Adineta steineri]